MNSVLDPLQEEEKCAYLFSLNIACLSHLRFEWRFYFIFFVSKSLPAVYCTWCMRSGDRGAKRFGFCVLYRSGHSMYTRFFFCTKRKA